MIESPDAVAAMQGQREQGQQQAGQAQAGGGPQQSADVEARRAQHCVQRVAFSALQPAPVHAVVGLGVADSGSMARCRFSLVFCLGVSDLNLPRWITLVMLEVMNATRYYRRACLSRTSSAKTLKPSSRESA